MEIFFSIVGWLGWADADLNPSANFSYFKRIFTVSLPISNRLTNAAIEL